MNQLLKAAQNKALNGQKLNRAEVRALRIAVDQRQDLLLKEFGRAQA